MSILSNVLLFWKWWLGAATKPVKLVVLLGLMCTRVSSRDNKQGSRETDRQAFSSLSDNLSLFKYGQTD